MARHSVLLGSESKPIDSFMSAYKCAKVFSVVWLLSISFYKLSPAGHDPDKSVTFVRFRNYEPDNFFCLALVSPMSGSMTGIQAAVRPDSGSVNSRSLFTS